MRDVKCGPPFRRWFIMVLYSVYKDFADVAHSRASRGPWDLLWRVGGGRSNVNSYVEVQVLVHMSVPTVVRAYTAKRTE